MMNLKKIFFLSSVLLLNTAIAQIHKKLPVPPEAASLGKYVDFPISLHNGTPEIRIDLYRLSTYGYQLPIALNYHASGIKVQEIGSRQGIGWSLQAGGIITRVVKDKPDVLYTERSSGEIETSDLEKDIFYYNFGSFTGKFLLNRISNSDEFSVSKIDRNELKISYQSFTDFIITDANGIEYTFQPLERTLNRSEYYETVEFPPGTIPAWHELDYTSSWYLKKIRLNNRQEIIFKYEKSVTINYEVRKTETFIHSALFPQGSDPITNLPAIAKQTVNAYLLTGISSNNTTVKFHYDLERQDLQGDKALTSVDVYNMDNTLIKKFDLEYIFISADVCPSSVSSYECKRLFLKSIEESNGCESLPPYQFEYNETLLPHRNSYEQDDWGFFNNRGNTTWVPKIFVYPNSSRDSEKYLTFAKPGSSTNIILDGADKSANPFVVQAGILKYIKYPLGGSLAIEYEPNDFLWFSEASNNVEDAYNMPGGGVRVKKMTVSDGHGKEVIESYSYDLASFPGKTSGAILQLPIYAYPGVYANISLPDQGLMNPSYYEKIVIRYGENQAMLGDSESGKVGYRYVTVRSSASGKTVNHYSFPGAYGEFDDDPASGCSFEMQGVCDNLYQPHTISYNVYGVQSALTSSGVELLSNEPNTFPFTPHTNYEFNRGLLLEQIFFNENGDKIKSINNEYALMYSDDRQSEGISRIVCCGNSANLFYVRKSSTYDLLLNVSKKLSRQTEKFYNNDQLTLTKEISYEYDLATTLNTVTSVKSSIGDEVIQRNIYAFQFETPLNYTGTDTQVGAIIRMKETRNIANPIEKQTWRTKNGIPKLVGSQLTKFRIENDMIVPSEEYSLATTEPLITYNPPRIENSNFLFDASHFVKSKEFLSFNEFGFPLEVLDLNGITESYVFGAKSGNSSDEYLVANASNATISEIAFTSFEDENTHGWEYGLSGIITHEYRTGERAFLLTGREIVKSSIAPGEYWLTYWQKADATVMVSSVAGSIQVSDFGASTNGNWTLATKLIHVSTGNSSFKIFGSGVVDELRFYPKKANFKSFAHISGVGLITSTDENSNSQFYRYDQFKRLGSILNNDLNIIKSYKYNYAISPSPSSSAFFDFDAEVDKYATEQLEADVFYSGFCENKPFSYSVNFGDGANLLTQDRFIRHHYASPGIYNLTMKLRDSQNTEMSSLTKEVIINPMWENFALDFTYSVVEVADDEYVVYVNSIFTPDTSFPYDKSDILIIWDFEAGGASGKTTSFTYTSPSKGNYNVSFSMIDKKTKRFIKSSPIKSIHLY